MIYFTYQKILTTKLITDEKKMKIEDLTEELHAIQTIIFEMIPHLPVEKKHDYEYFNKELMRLILIAGKIK